MLHRRVPISLTLVLWGCGTSDPSHGMGATDVESGSVPSPEETGGTAGPPAPADSGSSAGEIAESSSEGSSIKLDVSAVTGAGDDGGTRGCSKVDFLFVVDNSGSMGDHQLNLATSVPGFIDGIMQTVGITDFRILVVDTDGINEAKNLGCSGVVNGHMGCDYACANYCPFEGNCLCECGGQACIQGAAPCDVALGSGVTQSNSGTSCEFATGLAWMDDAQPDLAASFSCAALRGAGGSGEELTMQAAIEALTVQNGAGACNDGFVRDDALLVLTVITDEEDGDPEGKSASFGDPASWAEAVAAVKGGNADAVVPLMVVGDRDTAMPTCGAGGDDEPCPNLRAFADAFEFGRWWSVCAPDYAPYFTEAIESISGACEVFEPAG